MPMKSTALSPPYRCHAVGPVAYANKTSETFLALCSFVPSYFPEYSLLERGMDYSRCISSWPNDNEKYPLIQPFDYLGDVEGQKLIWDRRKRRGS